MTWEKKTITIVTKAYPEKSRRHGSVACTAGITSDGEWIRLYPIDMRHFVGKNKISKFDIIEVECKKDKDKLGRKESYKVRPESIKILDKSLTKPKVDWKRRNDIVLPMLSESIESLQQSYEEDKTSLGLIKPVELLEFIKTDQLQIYEHDGWSYTTNLDGIRIPQVIKIPHIFKYRFTCQGCKEQEHNMQCEDWELFESYRRWGSRYRKPEILWEKLKDKFFDKMIAEKDLYFIMGMYSQYPTWFIVGLYYPPKNK